MSDAPAESIDVDALMRLIRDEARRRNKQPDTEFVSLEGERAGQDLAFAVPQLFGDIAFGKDLYTIAELTKGHGEAFVRNAYRALLRRSPDPEGMAHFMAMLRAGRSKLAILSGIRYSAEGRRLAVKVPGLYRRHLAERVFGLPLIGPIVESLAALVRIRSLLLHHRALEETSLSLAESIANESVHHSNVLAARLADTSRVLSAQSERTNVIAAELTSVSRAASLQGERANAMEAELANTSQTLSAQVERTDSIAAQLRAELARQADAIQRNAEIATQDFRQLDSNLESQRIAIQQTSAHAQQQELRIDALASRMGAAEEKAAELVGGHSIVAKRVDRLIADAGHRWAPLQDAFYADFEEQFRGTTADIKSRLAVYLPHIKAADAGSATAPVVDLGCGRGEWLELLRDDGLVARGCDSNGTFVDRCLKSALVVAQQDLFEYLETFQDATVGAVTSFHVVEHLPFADVIHLLNETMRVLRPGGIAIMETPNPENLRVGACDFYLDPTHRHPIPPAMLAYVVGSRGFVDVEVVRLHPLASLAGDQPSVLLMRELDGLLQGPRDYAVIFRRPSS